MSLTEVLDDYERELAVLHLWQSRLNQLNTPENDMSSAYRAGWMVYLDRVIDISKRMIKMCEDAKAQEQNGAAFDAEIKRIKDALQDEAGKYDKLADAADADGLDELVGMLRHEADSRREIIAEL